MEIIKFVGIGASEAVVILMLKPKNFLAAPDFTAVRFSDVYVKEK